MPTTVFPDLNFDLIQVVRLVQALAESSFRVYIPPQDIWRFEHLNKFFPITFSQEKEVVLSPPHIVIRHDAPLTAVGAVELPLIFPHSILQHCRERWPSRRDVFVSFCGLVTEQRRAILQEWLTRHGVRDRLPTPERTLLSRIRRKLNPNTLERHTRYYDLSEGKMLFWSSNRGRHFPVKAWDEEYFDVLHRSRFVLCPNGDYIWSYRFFEAVMCGAVPIVQDACPAYEGFQFHTMSESNYDWSIEKAEHNYALCRERLTVAKATLDAELTKLIASGVVGERA